MAKSYFLLKPKNNLQTIATFSEILYLYFKIADRTHQNMSLDENTTNQVGGNCSSIEGGCGMESVLFRDHTSLLYMTLVICLLGWNLFLVKSFFKTLFVSIFLEESPSKDDNPRPKPFFKRFSIIRQHYPLCFPVL